MPKVPATLCVMYANIVIKKLLKVLNSLGSVQAFKHAIKYDTFSVDFQSDEHHHFGICILSGRNSIYSCLLGSSQQTTSHAG